MATPTPVLNHNLLFTQLSPEEQASFRIAPAPEHMALPRGTRLYKWTSYPLITWRGTGAARTARITSFWSVMDGLTTPSGRTIESFTELRKRYRNTGGSVGAPRDAARARLAVTREWNTMDAILFMQLDQLVWGYVGQAATQPEREGRPHTRFIGGDWQVVIPGLQQTHCHQIG